MSKRLLIAPLALCVCAPLVGATAGDGADTSYATSEIVAGQALSDVAGSAPQSTAAGDTRTMVTGDAVAIIRDGKYGITESTAASGIGTGSHHAVALQLDFVVEH
jgi:hypothetical protein